jgi:hypothetical protein
MPKILDQVKDFKDYFQKKIYTDVELREFGKELEPFRIKRTTSKGEELSYIDQNAYLESLGLMKKRKGYGYAIMINTRSAGYDEHKKNKVGEEYTVIGDQPYVRERDKLDQWINWRGRMCQGYKMADLQLEELASSKEITADDIDF